MIRFQVIERPGEHLFSALCAAMAGGDLKTFGLQKRRRKVVHASYPGWMNWSHESGVILCEVISPAKPGFEWQFFHAFIGRLANRFADKIHGVSIQFVTEDEEAAASRPPRRRHLRRPRKRSSSRRPRRRRR